MLSGDDGGSAHRGGGGAVDDGDGFIAVDPRDVEEVLLAAAETIASCMQGRSCWTASPPPPIDDPGRVCGGGDLSAAIKNGKGEQCDQGSEIFGSGRCSKRSCSRECEAAVAERFQTKRRRSNDSGEQISGGSGIDNGGGSGIDNGEHDGGGGSGEKIFEEEKTTKKKRKSVFERLSFQRPSPSPSPSPSPGPFLEPGALEGMIFGCTSGTRKECQRRRLFGLPASHRDNVCRVAPGTVLFLFNFDTKDLSGVYEAVSHGSMNIVENAFRNWGSFPAQVEVRRVLKCRDLPLADFKLAIRKNFFKGNKFRYDLTGEQVDTLVEMFKSVLQ